MIGPQGPPGPKGEPGEPGGGYMVGTTPSLDSHFHLTFLQTAFKLVLAGFLKGLVSSRKPDVIS